MAQTPDSRIRWPAGHGPEGARVFTQNTININATPAIVWALLIDCVAWPSWYKHCSDVSMRTKGGALSAGSRFRFKTIGSTFEPLVEVFQPFEMLAWTAQGPLGTSGAHAWYLEATPSGCRVITEEAQRGALLYLFGGRIQKTLFSNHEDWLQGLKKLAEESSTPGAATMSSA